jgi:hypothetical protein
MHRFSWDLRYEPIGEEPRAGGGATGAVPGRTYPRVDAPWAAAGRYTVRLAVNGAEYTQPMTVRLDPRVTTSAEELERLASLSREMWEGAWSAHTAYEEARAMVAELRMVQTPEAATLVAQVEALAPAPPEGGFGGRRLRRAAPSGPPTLNGVSQEMMSAAMAMQDAEVAPTARQVAACEAARSRFRAVMEQWSALRP